MKNTLVTLVVGFGFVLSALMVGTFTVILLAVAYAIVMSLVS